MSNALSSMDKNSHAKHVSDHSKRQRDVSIGQYLINRLEDYGIRDCFGIPGDYVLNFYSMLEESDINVVGCTREDCGFCRGRIRENPRNGCVVRYLLRWGTFGL